MADVVIVGSDGTEHVFPEGFDPQKAAAIVREGEPKSQGWMSSLSSIASPAGFEGLKQYGKELATGGPARSAVADYGKKEGGAFLSTLNPINQAKGVLRMVTTNPATTIKGLYDTGKSALEGDPSAVGSVLGMAVAPKADAAVLRGVNSAATAVADSPKLQGTAGYIGGAGVGIAGGGHPFIMGRIGQAAGPVIGGAARGVANVTGKMMDTLGMDRPGALPKEFDRYAPNISSNSSGATAEAAPIPQGIPQGVYTELPNGGWGVKALPGHQLVEGESVNVMNRAGVPSVHTVGKLGPGGIASIGMDAPAPAPMIRTPHGDLVPMNARLLELLKQQSRSD